MGANESSTGFREFEAKRERTTPTTRFDFFTDSLFFFCVSRRFVCLLWPKSSTSSFQLRRYFEQPKKKKRIFMFLYISFPLRMPSSPFIFSFLLRNSLKELFFFFTQDHMTHDQMLVCDLVGIFAMIFGSFLSACHLSFYCEDVLRVFYQSMVTIMCVIGVVLVRSYFMSAFAHRLVRLCK